MIKIIIIKKNEYIKEFIIKGHANSAKKLEEFDLVCAGVSAIVMGILNSLNLKDINVEIKDGLVSIVINNFSEENEFILNILRTSLITIEESYRKHISIKEEIK